MLKNVLAENAILRIVNQSRELYIPFADLYEKANWFVDRTELYRELDRLVKNGYIRIKGIDSELYIRIIRAGIAFLVECT